MSVLDTINTFIANNAATIRNRQELFKTANGKYWQGLPSHPTVPATPTPAATRWNTRFPSLAGQFDSFRITCDEYESTQGRGYIFIIEVIHNGNEWRRVYSVGPEDFGTPWKRSIPPASK